MTNFKLIKRKPRYADRFTIFTAKASDVVEIRFSKTADIGDPFADGKYSVAISSVEQKAIEDFLVKGATPSIFSTICSLLGLKISLSKMSRTGELNTINAALSGGDFEIRSRANLLGLRTHVNECKVCASDKGASKGDLCDKCASAESRLAAMQADFLKSMGIQPEQAPTKH